MSNLRPADPLRGGLRYLSTCVLSWYFTMHRSPLNLHKLFKIFPWILCFSLVLVTPEKDPEDHPSATTMISRIWTRINPGNTSGLGWWDTPVSSVCSPPAPASASSCWGVLYMWVCGSVRVYRWHFPVCIAVEHAVVVGFMSFPPFPDRTARNKNGRFRSLGMGSFYESLTVTTSQISGLSPRIPCRNMLPDIKE